MGRKAVPTAINSKHFTKREREERSAIENRIRGDGGKIRCPKDITREQKNIFRQLVRMLEPAEILSSLDAEIIRSAAISADRVHTMNKQIDEEPMLLKNAVFMSSLKFYQSELDRCLIELGMTPQARAKIALPKKEEDPLLAVLSAVNDDEDDEEE